jgi:hypothetical protein
MLYFAWKIHKKYSHLNFFLFFLCVDQMNESIIIVLYLFVYHMICVVNTEGWCIYGSHLLLIFDRILYLFSHFHFQILNCCCFSSHFYWVFEPICYPRPIWSKLRTYWIVWLCKAVVVLWCVCVCLCQLKGSNRHCMKEATLKPQFNS